MFKRRFTLALFTILKSVCLYKHSWFFISKSTSSNRPFTPTQWKEKSHRKGSISLNCSTYTCWWPCLSLWTSFMVSLNQSIFRTVWLCLRPFGEFQTEFAENVKLIYTVSYSPFFTVLYPHMYGFMICYNTCSWYVTSKTCVARSVLKHNSLHLYNSTYWGIGSHRMHVNG